LIWGAAQSEIGSANKPTTTKTNTEFLSDIKDSLGEGELN
jgi:hypothetical protein